MIKVRRHDNDAPLIEYLDSKFFSEDERVDYIKESAWWIGWKPIPGELEDKPVAYGGCRILPGTKLAFLSRAGVLPDARGQGLQRRLISVRLTWAKSQGAEKAITYTHPLNIVSANNLIKMGFLLYLPEYAWADSAEEKFLYFFKDL